MKNFFLFKYLKYHLYEKFRFTYFEINLNKFSLTFPIKDDSLNIRKATKEDIEKIKTDLYPEFDDKQEFYKKYINKIGKKDISCFICEKNNKIVHYLIVFENALKSPLMKTPIKKKIITHEYAFLGDAFTVPSARGVWILPRVLEIIIEHLLNNTSNKKAILLVHEDTPGAKVFFRKLGFNEIKNPVSTNFFFG